MLTKRANTSVVEAGGLARYSIVVHNRGPATAEDVVVSDQVRSAFRVRSAKPSQGSCDLTRQTVTCELGSIAAGRSATVKSARASRTARATPAITPWSVVRRRIPITQTTRPQRTFRCSLPCALLPSRHRYQPTLIKRIEPIVRR